VAAQALVIILEVQMVPQVVQVVEELGLQLVVVELVLQ
jgi:hypothetical protein